VKTVAVCDTEPVAIEGLRSLLQSADGLCVVAACTSLSDAMEAVWELKPDLLILDKSLGIEPVMECLRTLRDSGCGTGTVVWGTSLSEPDALHLLHAGARGVVRKTSPLCTVMDCIRSAARGGGWIEDDLIASMETASHVAHSPLTCRELQVAELVERGMRNKDIAAELGIQIGTVKIHMKHIFEKTGIRGRYGLALSGLRDKRMTCQ
jgi:DNA-binding NarL/FixJ family response regulator